MVVVVGSVWNFPMLRLGKEKVKVALIYSSHNHHIPISNCLVDSVLLETSPRLRGGKH